MQGDSVNPDDRLSYKADYFLDEQITRVRWLTSTSLIVATRDGNLYTMELGRDSQNVECLEHPKLLYQAEHEVAIWDVTVYNKAPRLEVWLAEDSGKVTQLSIDISTLQLQASSTIHVS